jgi:hypothetical protein
LTDTVAEKPPEAEHSTGIVAASFASGGGCAAGRGQRPFAYSLCLFACLAGCGARSGATAGGAAGGAGTLGPSGSGGAGGGSTAGTAGVTGATGGRPGGSGGTGDGTGGLTSFGGSSGATEGAGSGGMKSGGGGSSGSGGQAAVGGASQSGGAAGMGSAGVGGGGNGGTGSATSFVSFYPQDIAFTSKANKTNPYLDVTDFKVTFSGPGGVKLTLPGFYAGGQVWKVRFAPTRAGAFTYVTSSAQDVSLDGLTGTVPPGTSNPNGHGAIRVDPALPHHYLYDDGTRYFQMGYELDWLAMMDFGDASIAKAKSIIDMVAGSGFSEVLMNAYAYDTSWKKGNTSAIDFGPPALIAWPGTNAAPDQTKMNEPFWQNYDRVIAYLFEKGLTAHIYFKVYTKMVNWPANGSADDDLYFKFIVARYQAYSNVVWDFSKESYYETDQSYIATRLNLIKTTDAYQRLRTLHDPDGAQSQLSPNYYDNPAHEGTVDFYTDQSSNPYATAKEAITKRAMPYLNAETTLYQVGNDGTFTYGHYNSQADVFAASMEVLMAGGYFAFYYSLQAWDVDKFTETPNGISSYKYLSDFMKSTGWYKMVASDPLIGGGATGIHCLADPGREYIVFTNGARSLTLNVVGATGTLAAKWLNLGTGAQSPLPEQSNGAHVFSNPWSGPAMLYLVAH